MTNHDAAAQAFHEANPWVFDRLVKETRREKALGYTHAEINLYFAQIRLEHRATHDPNSEFKVNNNYRAWYAREIMRVHPDLDGMFKIRSRAGDDE